MSGPLPDPIPEPRDWRRAYALQLVIAFAAGTAMNATRPTLTYRALDLGAGPFEVGVVQAALSLIPVLTAISIGRWVDRFGEGRFLLLAMAIMSLGGLMAATAASIPMLAISQVVTGLGQIFNLVAAQAMIANYGPRHGREERFGLYAMMNSLGQMAGPTIAAALLSGAVAIGPLASGNRTAPVFLFAAAATGIAILLTLMIPGTPRRTEAPPGSASAPLRGGLLSATWQVVRRPGMLPAMLVSIVVISAIDLLIAYLPAYGEAHGISVEVVGTLLAVRAGASLVTRVFMGRLIDLLGRGQLLAVSTGAAAVGLAALPFTSSTPLLVVLMILMGLGLGLGQPMTIAWIANRSPRAERATALAVRLTGNRAALLVVPTVMGAIAGVAGVGAIFWLAAAGLGASVYISSTTPFDDLVEEREEAIREARRQAESRDDGGDGSVSGPAANPPPT